MKGKLNQFLKKLNLNDIPSDRKQKLQKLIDFIHLKHSKGESIQLNFICTHNSRRSQFCQVWAAVASAHYNIPILSFSGGVEVTEFNSSAIESLKRAGFFITQSGERNAHYSIQFSINGIIENLYSKLLDDRINPKTHFAAIMTCNDADQNCPIVSGCDVRISLPYDDPKQYDGSEREAEMYDKRSVQIATEMMYVFSKIH